MNNVFILHATEDNDVAMLLGRLLKGTNLTVYFDKSILSGKGMSGDIHSRIKEAAVILVLLSRFAKKTHWLEEEIAVVLEKGHTVIPILLDTEAKNNWIWPLLSDRKSIRIELESDLNNIVTQVTQAIEGPIPNYLIDITISDMALSLSRKRKIGMIYGNPDAIDTYILSTTEEMEMDWQEARSYFALNVLKRVIIFTHLSPNSYVHLEKTWLRKVKEILAYFYWKAGSRNGTEKDFFEAAREIRSWMLEREQSNLEDFHKIKAYLLERYLTEDYFLDETKPHAYKLIAIKAKRIWEMTGESNSERNWHKALLYVKLFYENIIGAVLDSDKVKTTKILEAFEFSKAPENKFIIINAFEAALAIEFLDKGVLNKLIDSPEHDINMVSVDRWPEKLISLRYLEERLEYDQESGQVIYIGKMDVSIKTKLLAEIKKEKDDIEYLSVIVEHLYNQSQQKPYREQVL